MIYILILFTMVFIHIMLDFHQGETIATMKTKKWWLEHPDYKDKYKYDYIVVLLVHGLSWAFAIDIPIFVYMYKRPILYNNNLLFILLTFIIFNGLGHAFIDHLKANLMFINLITDQILHLIQILIIWGIFVYTFVSYYNIFDGIKGGIL